MLHESLVTLTIFIHLLDKKFFFYQEADKNSSTVLKELGKSDNRRSSNLQDSLARDQKPIQELRLQHAINKDVISSSKPSSPVYEQPDSSEYEYPAWAHTQLPYPNFYPPKSKNENTEDASSNGYFTPYVRSPEDKCEDDSLLYQSLIHHGVKRNEDDVTEEKSEEDEMSYVNMPDNRFCKNSQSPEQEQENSSTYESCEGQQEQLIVDETKTKKADIDASDEYFTPLVRLPENTYSDFLHYQSLIHNEKDVK